MILAALLLLSGLAISAVAIYYSVVGLTAIFAAAAIPIMIMGISLEVGKLVIASWVKAYWSRIPILMRTYAVSGVVVLMVITSLGIFGFLSKAHSDQTLVSGDVQSKIAVYDEKIKTEKENIEADRRALKQLDEAVDQVLGRSTTETGADRAVAIRRSQQKERARLQAEISQSQQSISQLNDARAPIAAEVRKVEAEVGPIKYIAAFVYGDNPDASILERAVTWVIILIVVVFDPLAVVMLLAAQMTWAWYKNPEPEEREYVASGSGATVDELVEQEQAEEEPAIESEVGSQQTHDYLQKPFVHFENLQPMPAPHPEPEPKLATTPFEVVDNGPNWTLINADKVQQQLNEAEHDVVELANYIQNLQQNYDAVTDLHQRSMTREADLIEENAHLKEELAHALAMNEDRAAMSIVPPEEIQKIDPGFVYQPEQPKSITDFPELQAIIKQGLEDGTLTIMGQDESASEASMAPTSQPEPEVTEVKAEVIPDVERPGDYITDPVEALFAKREPKTGFGNNFPDDPTRGDLFLRTDFRPNRLFKWNDKKWIEVNKNTTTAYIYNDAYIQFLTHQVLSQVYNWDDLTEQEQEQVQLLIGGNRG